MKTLAVLFALLGLGLSTKPNEDLEEGHCHMTAAYPPPSNRTIGWYEIDLDSPAKQRWQGVIQDLMQPFKDMMAELFNHLDEFRVVKEVLSYIDGHEEEILDRYPSDWGDELRGISEISGVDLGELIVFNMGYEIMGVCTSIVACNAKTGQMVHGRNLDFGLFLGVNWTEVQWQFTEKLKPCTFNAKMMKGGQVLYSATWYAGYIGLLTGVRQNAMTITVDTRFDDNHDKYLIDWIMNPSETSLQFLSFTTRMAMETTTDFDSAVDFIKNTPILCPAYIIIGGPQPYQGGVLSLGPNMTLVDWWDIPNALPADAASEDKWYVLETNYDHWNQPPWYDDRRYPAEDCMEIVGTNNIAVDTLYNVLNGKPNRNRLTTYTALMVCETGHLEAYRQYCTDPDCIPW